MTKTITERALFARVARKLYREEGVFLHRRRWNAPYFNDTGRYYCSDSRNCICNPSFPRDSLLPWAIENGVVTPDTVEV